MLWKAGCLVAVLGLVVSFSSCALFGRAIQTATDVHDVANLPVEPGRETIHSGVVVDLDRNAQIRIEATTALTEAILEETRERSSIVQVSAPVNYAVSNGQGDRLHTGAGAVSGSAIVPDAESPHRDSFDPKVAMSHSSAPFSPIAAKDPKPGDGQLTIRVDLPAFDDDENPITSARVFVVERPLSGAGGWTAGGFASMIFGPIVAFVGTILFVIGLFTRRKTSQLPPAPGPR